MINIDEIEKLSKRIKLNISDIQINKVRIPNAQYNVLVRAHYDIYNTLNELKSTISVSYDFNKPQDHNYNELKYDKDGRLIKYKKPKKEGHWEKIFDKKLLNIETDINYFIPPKSIFKI